MQCCKSATVLHDTIVTKLQKVGHTDLDCKVGHIDLDFYKQMQTTIRHSVVSHRDRYLFSRLMQQEHFEEFMGITRVGRGVNDSPPPR
jgi:hypothetical protein